MSVLHLFCSRLAGGAFAEVELDQTSCKCFELYFGTLVADSRLLLQTSLLYYLLVRRSYIGAWKI